MALNTQNATPDVQSYTTSAASKGRTRLAPAGTACHRPLQYNAETDAIAKIIADNVVATTEPPAKDLRKFKASFSSV